MTIQELFDFVQEVKPHQYEPETLLVWLNTLEKSICEFYDEFEDNPLVQYDEEGEPIGFVPHTDVDEQLFVDETEMYTYWLASRIDFANNEYTYYNNDVLMFNAMWDEFRGRYGRNKKSKMTKYIKIK